MDGNESHEDILKSYIGIFHPQTAVEFGCGFFSTKILCELIPKYVLSLEMNDQSWYERVALDYSVYDNLHLLWTPGAERTISFVRHLKRRFDLAFVDGDGSSRPEQINEIVHSANTIVVHDTETFHYRWDKVIFPDKGWAWIDIKNFDPWTSVFTNQQPVYDWCINNWKSKGYIGSGIDKKDYLR